MKAHFEKVSRNSAKSFCVYERVDEEFEFYWHYHPELELTLIVDSAGQRFVGNSVQDYGPFDLVLLGADLPHTWRSGPLKQTCARPHRAIVVQFPRELLSAELLSLEGMSPVAELIGRATHGLSFHGTQAGQAVTPWILELPSLSPGRRLVSLLSILLELATEETASSLTSGAPHDCRREDQDRINRVCSYLDSHCSEKIDFGTVAEVANMSQAALCRFFKRATGRTMTEYLTETRLSAAAQLLTDTDSSALDISLRAGFDNYSNFCRQFKRVRGCSPRAFRSAFHSATHPA